MTIEQIQAAIDAKADARQIINMIADYIQANPGGGGGLTLYSGDGTITSDRTVDLNGKYVNFSQGGQSFLLVDPTVDGENVRLRAYNNTDDGNEAYFTGEVNTTETRSIIAASFNGEAKLANINAFADATTSTLTYTADNNIFPSAVAADFANDAAAAVGGIPVGGLYHTAGAAKIRLS